MENKIIQHTKNWLQQVVIGCNFCPFAHRPAKENRIHYQLIESDNWEIILQQLVLECQLLDQQNEIETSLLIIPNAVEKFEDYLDLVATAETLLIDEGYEGIYQLASFHPQYIFAQSNENDPANYTNRSPYPLLHILREESLEKAIDSHPNTEDIPLRNIAFTQEKGLAFMQQMRDDCID